MKQMKRLLVVLVVMVFALGFSGIANANLIRNGSFENGSPSTFMPVSSSYDFMTLDSTNSTAGDILGWTVTRGTIDWIGTYWSPSDLGSYSVDLDGSMPGTIQQTFATTAGTWYEVLFDMAGNPDGAEYATASQPDYQPKSMEVTAGSDFAQYSFNSTGYSHGNMGWDEQSFIFQAAGGASTTLEFKSIMPADSVYGIALDNVRVSETTAPVPEPATIFLLGIGLIGLAGFGRKKFFKMVG